MSQENDKINDKIVEEKRDLLDGGFAVVDREKLIEEETRQITPWYKHFINVFIAPRKMMEENFYADPPKGMSVAVVGAILFTVLQVILTIINPIIKEQAFNTYRMQDVAENMLEQKYMMQQIGGVVGSILGVFLAALFISIGIQIIKVIAKDKAKFGMIYRISLLTVMVASAFGALDRLIGYFIPTSTIVLGLPIVLDPQTISTSPLLATLASVVTLPSIASLVILTIGYAVITHTSNKKAIIVVAIYEFISILISFGILSVTQGMLQGVQMMG